MNLAIFDIDGTLTNTNNVDEDCFVKAFAEAHSINDIVTDWTAYPHTTDSGITQHIFQEKFGRSPEETELSKLNSGMFALPAVLILPSWVLVVVNRRRGWSKREQHM